MVSSAHSKKYVSMADLLAGRMTTKQYVGFLDRFEFKPNSEVAGELTIANNDNGSGLHS